MYNYDKNFAKNKLLEEYKRIYEFEIQRKDAFGSKLSIAIAIITLVIGAITAMVTRLPFADSFYRTILYLLIILTYLCLGISLLQLFWVIKPREYSYLADIKKIDNKIRSMHQKNRSSEEMASEFNNFLVNRYCEAASNNRAVNNRKSSHFVKTIIGLYLSVIFLFISIGLFAFCSYGSNDDVSKIQVVSGPIQIDPNRPILISIDNKGDNKMSNGDKKPEDQETTDWPENDKINESEDISPEKTSKEQQQ